MAITTHPGGGGARSGVDVVGLPVASTSSSVPGWHVGSHTWGCSLSHMGLQPLTHRVAGSAAACLQAVRPATAAAAVPGCSRAAESASLGRHRSSAGPLFGIQTSRASLLGPEGGPRQAGGALEQLVAARLAARQGTLGRAAAPARVVSRRAPQRRTHRAPGGLGTG